MRPWLKSWAQPRLVIFPVLGTVIKSYSPHTLLDAPFGQGHTCVMERERDESSCPTCRYLL